MEALADETETIIKDIESMPDDEFKELLKTYPELLKLQFDKDSEVPKKWNNSSH